MKAPKLYDNMSFQPQKSKSGYVAEPNMIMREWCAEAAQAIFEKWWEESSAVSLEEYSDQRAELNSVQAGYRTLQSQLALAIEALEFYAHPLSHDSGLTHDGCEAEVNRDNGDKARTALEKIRGEK